MDETKVLEVETKEEASIEQVDLVSYYENNAGRLVVDPEYVSFLPLTVYLSW